MATNNCRVRRVLPLSGLSVLEVPAGETTADCIDRLMASGDFEYVESDRTCRPINLPNDPEFVNQSHLILAGLPGAWTFTVGSSAAPVAIVDTGVDITHPDLQNRLPGYNAITHTSEALGGDVTDTNGHGTAVAGVACATGNNGIGGTGVCWTTPYIPVKVSSAPSGIANMSKIIEGIEWAAANGAKVINVSMSGVYDNAAETVGLACWNLGVILVWGAGNDAQNTRDLPQFPSDWDHRHVIVVGATDLNDDLAPTSNFGKAIDVLAPGVDVLTTALGGGMATRSGTSLSTPIVSGGLALTFANEPGLSLEEAEFRIERSAYDLGALPRPGQAGFDAATYRPGNDEVFGWGRINFAEALQPTETRYDLLAIPTPGGSSSWAIAINDRGDVGGDILTPAGSHRPYVWLDQIRTYLPTFSGVPDETRLVDLNNNREALLYKPSSALAATWTSSSGLSYFDPPPIGYSEIIPYDINDDGKVVGFVKSGSVTSPRLWVGGQAQYDDWFWETWTLATSINKWGEIVGRGGGEWLTTPSFRATPEVGMPYQISDGGTVVGGGSDAALWLSDSSVHIMSSPLPDTQLYLQGVNEMDEAVGWASSSPPTAVVADLVRGPSPLMSHVRAASGFVRLEQAHKINNLGQIVGIGVLGSNNRQTGFIAHPVREVAGEFPIYLGALPPAFAVEFRRHDGSAYGPPIQTDPIEVGGRTFRVVVPSFVTGNFYVYLRLSNRAGDPFSLTPAYNGPGWLGWQYPPTSDYAALPLDTRTIPLGDLVGTDIDSDNEIGIGDYAVLSGAYGSNPIDPNWTKAADLDRDDEIGIGDYALLSSTYGRTGDP